MGNWNMTIQGVGPHGNGIEADVEQIYRKFVEDLKTAGHTIVHSSVTSGGAYFEPETIPPVKKPQSSGGGVIIKPGVNGVGKV